MNTTVSVSSSASFTLTADESVRYGANLLPVSVYVSPARPTSTNTKVSTCAWPLDCNVVIEVVFEVTFVFVVSICCCKSVPLDSYLSDPPIGITASENSVAVGKTIVPSAAICAFFEMNVNEV